jgi:hypothetical protein
VELVAVAEINGAEVGCVVSAESIKSAVGDLGVRGSILALRAPSCGRVLLPLAVSGGTKWLLIVSLRLRPDTSTDSVQSVHGSVVHFEVG